MVRTQIQLTEQQAERLRRLSAERGESVAQLIRQGIEQYLERHGTMSDQERREQTLRYVGAFRSGRTDISTHHDKYLAADYAT